MYHAQVVAMWAIAVGFSTFVGLGILWLLSAIVGFIADEHAHRAAMKRRAAYELEQKRKTAEEAAAWRAAHPDAPATRLWVNTRPATGARG